MGVGPSRARVAGIVAVVGVMTGVGAGMMGRRPPPPLANVIATTIGPNSVMVVHVAGWVASPGVVEVTEGAIVADVIAAAGGLRPGAGVTSLNLAAPVAPGDQIVVPGPGTEAQAGNSSGDGLVSLNNADISELETLPGVGPVLAERIVAFREERGRFETVEDLLEVPGIGESKLASIRDLVRP